MSFQETFSQIAASWNLWKSIADEADIDHMCENSEHEAYIIRCINRFNEDTEHLSRLELRNDQELRMSLNVIKQLNLMECRDSYADYISKLIDNIDHYISKMEKVRLRLVA